MDAKIDLDEASAQIARRAIGWKARGLDVGVLTYRDQARRWPHQVVVGRENAAEPDSVCVEVRAGAEEGRVVLYAGGWADLEYWDGASSDGGLFETVGYDGPLTQEDFGRALDDFGAQFRRNRHPGTRGHLT